MWSTLYVVRHHMTEQCPEQFLSVSSMNLQDNDGTRGTNHGSKPLKNGSSSGPLDSPAPSNQLSNHLLSIIQLLPHPP